MVIKIDAPKAAVKKELDDWLQFNWFDRTYHRGGYSGMRLGPFVGVGYCDGDDWVRNTSAPHMYGFIRRKNGQTVISAFRWYGFSFTMLLIAYFVIVLVMLFINATADPTEEELSQAFIWGCGFLFAFGFDLVWFIGNFFVRSFHAPYRECADALWDFLLSIKSACEHPSKEDDLGEGQGDLSQAVEEDASFAGSQRETLSENDKGEHFCDNNK